MYTSMYAESPYFLVRGETVQALTLMIAANNLVAMQDATSAELDLKPGSPTERPSATRHSVVVVSLQVTWAWFRSYSQGFTAPAETDSRLSHTYN